MFLSRFLLCDFYEHNAFLYHSDNMCIHQNNKCKIYAIPVLNF